MLQKEGVNNKFISAMRSIFDAKFTEFVEKEDYN